MEKYKLGILDPLEFERICKDLLMIKTSLEFRSYKPGKDAGIDLEANIDDKKIIAQCKRYKDYASLIKVLKEELEKISKINDLGDYYILTSIELSPREVNEIFNLFKVYMSTQNNIIDGTIISSMLDQPENCNILKKYPSLWLYNSSILSMINSSNIIIDTESLINKIKKNEKYYVDNKYLKDCIDGLNESNCLLIFGNPGVGKSTISYMLLLFLTDKYKNKNVKIRYSSIADYEDLKKSISLDCNEFEIIFVDDFFGTVYVEIKEKNALGLLSLIEYVKRCNNKILILNSRIGIFNSFKNLNSSFEDAINYIKISYVEVKDYTEIEKAKILYRRLKYDVPTKFYADLLKSKRYKNIINHPNYNPRLIENICSRKFYEKIPSGMYYRKCMEILENPSKIWEDDYKKVLSEADKVLLTSIYSFSNVRSLYDLVEESFNYRAKLRNFDSLQCDYFKESIKKLNESFIKIEFSSNVKYLSLINNSLVDFLSSMEENPLFKEKLIEESNISDQLVKITNWNLFSKCEYDKVYERINNNLSDKYELISKNVLLILKERDTKIIDETSYKTVSNILFNNDASLKKNCNYFRPYLAKLFTNSKKVYEYFIAKIITDFNYFEILCKNLDYDLINIFLEIWELEYHQSYDICFEKIKNKIKELYLNDMIEELEEYINENIYDAISYCDSDDQNYANKYEVEEYLIEKVQNEWDTKKIFTDYRLKPNLDYNDFEEFVENLDIDKEIENYYDCNKDEYVYESDFEINNNDDIDALFSTLKCE